MQLGEFNSKPGFRTGPSLDYIAPEFIFVKCFDMPCEIIFQAEIFLTNVAFKSFVIFFNMSK